MIRSMFSEVCNHLTQNPYVLFYLRMSPIYIKEGADPLPRGPPCFTTMFLQ